MTDEEIKLPANTLNVLRRIRRCEGEVAAQIVLEHFAIRFARAIEQATIEKAAAVCDAQDFAWPTGSMYSAAEQCADAIRALAVKDGV